MTRFVLSDGSSPGTTAIAVEEATNGIQPAMPNQEAAEYFKQRAAEQHSIELTRFIEAQTGRSGLE
jgi:hypothetical protein